MKKNTASDILKANILIVDDQERNVLLLEQLLAESGYTRVATTMDPQKVCVLHRENHYDLILLDLQMPKMDGFEVMAALKADDADDYLPVLVLTAQPGYKLQELQAGAKDFISKPFDLVAEMLGIQHDTLLGEGKADGVEGWNETERERLHSMISQRQSFLDFVISRVNARGAEQKYLVSGEPMFDQTARFVGYRGIGVEFITNNNPPGSMS